MLGSYTRVSSITSELRLGKGRILVQSSRSVWSTVPELIRNQPSENKPKASSATFLEHEVERTQQQERERKSREDRATGNDDSFRRYGIAWTEPNTRRQTPLQYKAQFAGASGLITSNFTLGATEEVINHFAFIFVPRILDDGCPRRAAAVARGNFAFETSLPWVIWTRYAIGALSVTRSKRIACLAPSTALLLPSGI
jgi:hypothetical protein